MKLSAKITLWFFVCLGINMLPLNQRASAGDDWQHWNAYSFQYRINDTVSVLFNPSFRLRDDISEFFYWETRQGLSLKLHRHLDLGLHYLYADDKNTKGVWTDEHRLEIQPTVKWQWAGLKFSDRNRAEYRSVNDKEKWRFRNRIKIAKPLEIGSFDISPYVYNEFFYDAKKDEYNQNRAAVGFSKKLTDHSSLDLYYMKKSVKKSGDWTGTNVIGMTLSFSL